MAMRKHLLASLIALLAFMTAGGAFAAQIQPTVSVNGALNSVCKAGTAGSLAFTIDPSLAGPIAATVVDATVFCSNGTPFTITAASLNKGGAAASCATPSGITGTLKTGANTMDYTFTCGTGGGTGLGHGAGKSVNLSLAGSINAASYQNAAVSASYTDTVTLTITY
jgi:spore coat protein U-like protein